MTREGRSSYRRVAPSIDTQRSSHSESPEISLPRSVSTTWAVGAHALAAALLCTTVAMCVLPGSPPHGDVVAAVYLGATLAALLGAAFSPRLGALSLIVAFYFFAFVAVPTMVQIRRGHFPFASTYTDEELVRGFIIVSLAQLALLMGVAAAGLGSKSRRPSSLSTSSTTEAEVARARGLAIAFTGVSAAFAAMAGPAHVFTARFDDARATLGDEGMSAQLVHVARAFVLVALLLSILARRLAPSPESRRRARNVLILTTCAVLVIDFPPALPRFQLLALVLAVLVLVIDFRRPGVKLVFSAAAAVFLLFVFSAIKDLRNGLTLEATTRERLGDYLITADFDSFKQVVDTTVYFANAPQRAGENFLGAALFWVPRSLWPGKPLHTGAIVSEGLGYPYNNVSSPLPAEGYASWGLAGAVVVMALIGLLIGRLEGRGGGKAMGTAIPRWISYAVATGYATILLRGALNAVAPMIFTAFVLAMVVNLAFRRRKPEASRTRKRPQSRPELSLATTPVREAHHQ